MYIFIIVYVSSLHNFVMFKDICKWDLVSLKERISSGLEGASARTIFGDLTEKQPCKLMHNHNFYNQMKIKLVWENSVYKGL